MGDDARREAHVRRPVERHAPDEETRDRILQNRIYQELSNAMAGSQEYMAMEKLYELHQEARYDLLVLDTPPTRHALDFIDAPERMTRFIEGKSLQFFLKPGRLGMQGARPLRRHAVLGAEADHRASTCCRTCRSSSRASATWRRASASAPSA